jgi:hypothetical protein
VIDMKKFYLVICMLFAASFTLTAEAGNIALGKTVTAIGVYGTSQGTWTYYPPAMASSLTDGLFVPEQQQWNKDSLWWNGRKNPANEIVIDLDGWFRIDNFVVQADNNDVYRIDYKNSEGNWLTAHQVNSVASWGLVTRDIDLDASIWTDALRFVATSGDSFHAVTEIQAFGTVDLPEASPLALILAGLLAIGFARRYAS